MTIYNSIKMIKPDDWHVHLREGNMMQAVIQYSSRINHRCIVMPNLETPITTSKQGEEYKNSILALNNKNDSIPTQINPRIGFSA